MLLSKLLENARNAQEACDKLLGNEPSLERRAKRDDMIFVHTYVVQSHLRRRSKRKRLQVIQGGRR